MPTTRRASPLTVLLTVALTAGLVACSSGSPGAGAPTPAPGSRTASSPGSSTSVPSGGPTSTAATGGATTTSTAATAAAVPAGATPAVEVAVALRSAAGDADVVVDVAATGFAPSGPNGGPAVVSDARVDYGDGVQAPLADLVGGSCSRGAPLGVLAVQRSVGHVYARPGTYTLTVAVATCRPGSTAARTTSRDLQVVVTRPPAGAAGVALDLRTTSPTGAAEVVLAVSATGTAPRAPGTTAAALMGVAVDFGDGTQDDAPPAATCDPAAPDAPLRFTDERRHTYARPGTFTVSYSLLTCVRDTATTTPTTRTLQVTVR